MSYPHKILGRIANPLVKKLWVKSGSMVIPLTPQKLLQNVNNINTMSPGMFELELNFFLDNISSAFFKWINQVIQATQDSTIGIEQKIPRIRICTRYDHVNEKVIKQVSQLDIFNPPIEFYITVPTAYISYFYHSERSELIGKIFQNYNINFHVFILLGSDRNSLNYLRNGKVSELISWLKDSKQLSVSTPVLEIALLPYMKKFQAFAESLFDLVIKHTFLLETTDSIYCGLLSFLDKMLKMHLLQEDLKQTIAPMLSHCGCAFTSSCLHSPNSTKISACPYKLPKLNNRLTLLNNKCQSCPWVKYCSGCLKALSSEKECSLQSFFSSLFKILSKNLNTISKSIIKRDTVPILEHDWDYIYDPFKMY